MLTSGSFSWNKWLTGWLEAISKDNQFYFILGGWAWINYEPLTKWLLQKRSWFSR
ncbi:hypothetical protein ACXO18_04415 [Lactobacillus delbrueckii subsp. bulgaricus]